MDAIRRALWTGEHAEGLVPELEAIASQCEPFGANWQFAHRQLALILAPTDPWRASLLARSLVEAYPRDHAGWAALGLAQSLLGQHRYAIHCYERALRLAPDEPRVAHNLGHLYDVALSDPRRAIPLLERAFRAEPTCPDIAASLAHALGRVGDARRGLSILREATERGRTRDQHELLDWLESTVLRERAPIDEPT
jgi:Flp pilus assembly protein TadD